jgi:hypothetical protein
LLSPPCSKFPAESTLEQAVGSSSGRFQSNTAACPCTRPTSFWRRHRRSKFGSRPVERR